MCYRRSAWYKCILSVVLIESLYVLKGSASEVMPTSRVVENCDSVLTIYSHSEKINVVRKHYFSYDAVTNAINLLEMIVAARCAMMLAALDVSDAVLSNLQTNETIAAKYSLSRNDLKNDVVDCFEFLEESSCSLTNPNTFLIIRLEYIQNKVCALYSFAGQTTPLYSQVLSRISEGDKADIFAFLYMHYCGVLMNEFEVVILNKGKAEGSRLDIGH